MRVTPIKTNFTAGELSPLLDGRIDIAKYSNGCKQLQNMIPLTQGCAVRRGGTMFVSEVKTSANKTWLSTFVFNYQQAFVLEFGVNYLRFYSQRGQLAVGSVTAWSNATAYVVGDLASRLGVNYYCKVAHTNQQPPNATYWYPLTGDILEIPTPFTAAMLTNDDGTFGLSLIQSGDVIYIATSTYPPQKLSRFSNVKWTIETIDFVFPPFAEFNTVEANLIYSDAQTGSVTLTAVTADTFVKIPVGGSFYLQQKIDDVTPPWEPAKSITINDLRNNEGKNYKALNTATTGYVPPIHTIGAQYDGDTGVQWEYQNPTYGIVQKATDASSTTMTGTVVRQIPDGATGVGDKSWVWAYPAWTDDDGYPTHVTFFRQRLVFARDRTIWFSVVGDYENFALAEFGSVLAESAISLNIDSSDTSQITYLSPTKQGLIVGTSSGEVIISESSIQDVFSATNVKVSDSTGYGSRNINPIKVDDSVLFVQRGGIKLRETQYNFQIDNFTATDLTILSEHIAKGGIVDMAYQLSPYSILWLVRADGVLLGFTYNKAQDVIAWHRHILGGAFSTGNAIVESVACIPSPDGLRDDLWLVIKRTINSTTERYVEYMKAEYDTGDDRDSAFYVDSGLTYDGVPADNISGLDHLIGQTVHVLADGSTHPTCVVNGSGEITLNREASVVQVGLSYTPILQTMRVEAGSRNGSAQGKIKRIVSTVIRLVNSLGVLVSNNGTDYNNLSYRTSADLMGQAVPLVSGDEEITLAPGVGDDGGYESDGYLYISQTTPLPMTIIAIIPQVTTYDKN